MENSTNAMLNAGSNSPNNMTTCIPICPIIMSIALYLLVYKTALVAKICTKTINPINRFIGNGCSL